MKKIYLPDGNDRLLCYHVIDNEDLLKKYISNMSLKYGEEKIYKIISQVETNKKDYLPNIDSMIIMTEYYRDSSLLGNGGADYTHNRSIGYRLLLGNLLEYYDTDYEEDILNLLKILDFEDTKGINISLDELKSTIEKNIVTGYDLFKNGSLKYSVKDYQDIILSQVDRLFNEYKEEALDNSKVLTLAYIKSNKKRKSKEV